MIQASQLQLTQDSQETLGFVLLMSRDGRPIRLVPMPMGSPDTLFAQPLQISDVPSHLSDDALSIQFMPAQQLLQLVENALKRLYDFSYLGSHPLTRLRVVRLQMNGKDKSETSLERAKAVSVFLSQTIERLRPTGPSPTRSAIPRREWHAYLILHQAYVQEEHNYTIMNWLQISEGTFNRTRRNALAIVAKTIAELEWQAQEGI